MASLSNALDDLLGGGGGRDKVAPYSPESHSPPADVGGYGTRTDGSVTPPAADGKNGEVLVDDPFASALGHGQPARKIVPVPESPHSDRSAEHSLSDSQQHHVEQNGNDSLHIEPVPVKRSTPNSSVDSKTSSGATVTLNGRDPKLHAHVRFDMDRRQPEKPDNGFEHRQTDYKSPTSPQENHVSDGLFELPQSPIDELLQQSGIDDIDDVADNEKEVPQPSQPVAQHKQLFRKGSRQSLLPGRPSAHSVIQHYWSAQDNADTPQAANFKKWLAHKRELQWAKIQQIEQEKRALEEKEKAKAERMEMAAKTFDAWRSSKAQQLKVNKSKKTEEQKLKETVEEDKKKEKQETAEKVFKMQVFKSWCEQKKELSKVKLTRQKTKKERQEEEKQRKEEEKRSLAESCFREWKRQKDAQLEAMRDKLRLTHERKKTAGLRTFDDVDEKRKEAQKAYEAWLQMKERERFESLYKRSRGLSAAHSLPSVHQAGGGRIDVPWLPPSPLVQNVNGMHPTNGYGATRARLRHSSGGNVRQKRPQTTYASHFGRVRF